MQLSSALFIASRFGFECIAIHEMPQPANRAGDRATTPSTTSLNPLSPPAERSSSPPPSLMFSRFARRPRSTIASIIDRFFLAWRVQIERPAVEPAETRGLIIRGRVLNAIPMFTAFQRPPRYIFTRMTGIHRGSPIGICRFILKLNRIFPRGFLPSPRSMCHVRIQWI